MVWSMKRMTRAARFETLVKVVIYSGISSSSRKWACAHVSDESSTYRWSQVCYPISATRHMASATTYPVCTKPHLRHHRRRRD